MSYPLFDMDVTYGFYSAEFHKHNGSAICLDAEGKQVLVSYVGRVPYLDVILRYFKWQDTIYVGRIFKFVGCVEGDKRHYKYEYEYH